MKHLKKINLRYLNNRFKKMIKKLNNEKNQENEKIYSSDKVIGEINGYYILQDNYHINNHLQT